MPITAAIIGGAVAVASTAASITANQIAASKQARAQQRMRAALESDESKSRHELEREENESALERADVRLGLTEAQETLNRQNDAARGQAAVMGTTNAGVAAQKEAAMKAFAEAQAKTIAAGDAAKQSRIDKKEEQLMGIHKEQRTADYEAEMKSIENMQQSVASAGQMAQSAAGAATAIAQAPQTNMAQQNNASQPNTTAPTPSMSQTMANVNKATNQYNAARYGDRVGALVSKGVDTKLTAPAMPYSSDRGKQELYSRVTKNLFPQKYK